MDYETEVEDEMNSIFRKGEVGHRNIRNLFLFILDSSFLYFLVHNSV